MKTCKLIVAFTFTAIVLTGFLISDGLAAEPSTRGHAQPIPEEVELYSRELNIVSNRPNVSTGPEKLLRLGRNAWHALVLPPSEGKDNVLGRLSEEDFQVVVSKMKGFIVNREEIYTVEPEPDFFLALAKRTGDQASVEFFDAYIKTEPNTWPVYIEQQTDYSGCIRYGTMSLVDTYTQWDAYSKKYPTRYTEEVTNFIRKVEEDLAEGTCACGDKESVLREFGAFIQAFPRAKTTTRLNEKINQIRQGKRDIREYCHSG